MNNIKRFAVTLPILVVPMAVMTSGPLKAEVRNVGPTGAVTILAQSDSADAKCRHLSSGEHSELGNYLAKAEIAAARMESAADAKSARRKGSHMGKAMSCGRESEELVRAALDAARRAMRAAMASKVKGQSAPQRRVKTQRDTSGIRAKIEQPRGYSSLTRYRKVTAAYYLERRCKHLSRAEAYKFWKKIVSNHNAVLRTYSGSQVAKAQKGAQAAARSIGSCGAKTARVVLSAYRG